MEYGSYRAVKLLEHGMKVLEGILEKRLRQKVKIDDMQLGSRIQLRSVSLGLRNSCFASSGV